MNYQRQQLQIVPECSKNFIQNEIRRRNSDTICRFHEQEDDSSEKPNRTRPRSVGRQLLRRRIQKEMLAERSDPHLTMNEQFLNVRDSDATSFPILSPSQHSLSLSLCVCVCWLQTSTKNCSCFHFAISSLLASKFGKTAWRSKITRKG
jgi:hypothetical protein